MRAPPRRDRRMPREELTRVAVCLREPERLVGVREVLRDGVLVDRARLPTGPRNCRRSPSAMANLWSRGRFSTRPPRSRWALAS
eukprot:6816178-Pyramimonas_sp.AAC.1